MKRIFIFFSLVLLLQGCQSALLYTSNNIPIPLLQEERETQIAVEYGMNGENFNLVASPFEHVALSLSGNYDKVSKKSEVSENGYEDKSSHNYSEGAIGYYEQATDKYIVEAYIGYGRGDGSDVNYEQYPFSNKVHSNLSFGKFEKYFFQTNVGSRNKNFTTGFAFRFSYLNFYQFVKVNDGVTNYPSKKEALIFEP
ncbi:MAG: membrane lipoprotein lipid attachment site-containing protein, partial [Ignavibacteriaceae bacterium]